MGDSVRGMIADCRERGVWRRLGPGLKAQVRGRTGQEGEGHLDEAKPRPRAQVGGRQVESRTPRAPPAPPLPFTFTLFLPPSLCSETNPLPPCVVAARGTAAS